MAVMALPDCLKWLETPQPRPGYIKKYISGYIDLVTIDFKFHPTSCKTLIRAH